MDSTIVAKQKDGHGSNQDTASNVPNYMRALVELARAEANATPEIRRKRELDRLWLEITNLLTNAYKDKGLPGDTAKKLAGLAVALKRSDALLNPKNKTKNLENANVHIYDSRGDAEKAVIKDNIAHLKFSQQIQIAKRALETSPLSGARQAIANIRFLRASEKSQIRMTKEEIRSAIAANIMHGLASSVLDSADFVFDEIMLKTTSLVSLIFKLSIPSLIGPTKLFAAVNQIRQKQKSEEEEFKDKLIRSRHSEIQKIEEMIEKTDKSQKGKILETADMFWELAKNKFSNSVYENPYFYKKASMEINRRLELWKYGRHISQARKEEDDFETDVYIYALLIAAEHVIGKEKDYKDMLESKKSDVEAWLESGHAVYANANKKQYLYKSSANLPKSENATEKGGKNEVKQLMRKDNKF